MKRLLVRWSMTCSLAALMVGCGGGGGNNGQTPVTPPAPVVVTNAIIAAASMVATNDTASNSSAPFKVVQDAGLPTVTVGSTSKLNFTVFSDGKVKSDLTISNVSVAIAKLVPGASGNPDEWQNYSHRTRAAASAAVGVSYTAAVKATLDKPKFAQTTTAYTDPKQTVVDLLAAQLVYNADGYYTYTFSTDIKNPAKTNGVTYEPGRTHRVAVQLSYTNAAGQAIKVNPYFDFTIDASGKSVPVTDPTKTRKMTDVSSCNTCHEKLGPHGGGRVDTQYCVMCHNPGSIDANSGNVLTLATMVHKIHSGRLLRSKLAVGGENYTIRSVDFSEVGFPQDLRNCTVCHSGANPNTPQGDNWKTKPTKEACLGCHASNSGSTWEVLHKVVAGEFVAAGASAKALPNDQCARCHGVGSVVSAERVHWNQVEANAAKYKMNIESVAFNDTADHKGRSVTVKYFLSDPTHGDAAYNLVTSDCASTTTPTCSGTTKFGNLRFYLAYQNMVGQLDAVTEFSAYNNGGSGANAYAYKGRNDGSNHYEVNIPLPDDSVIAVAKGSARVVSIGQVKENKLVLAAASDPRPEVVPAVQVNTLVQHSYKELALTGTLLPRRNIVANEKCNTCHGALGAASGSNTLANAFHSGARNTVESCVTCHDANRASSGNMMTNGLALYESYQFKRMIHGIHSNSKRASPFTHGNALVGVFNKDGSSATGGTPLTDSCGRSIGSFGVCLTPPGTVAALSTVENYAVEVTWPGVSLNCSACHIDSSYKTDMGTLGAVVKKPIDVVTGVTTTDPNTWLVISPKSATCTSCHDGKTTSGQSVVNHVIQFGGAAFGDKSQFDIAMAPRETCDDCHTNGGAKNVDIDHGQK